MRSSPPEFAGRLVADAGDATIVTATAPGRVNLLGEHTDYNQGFVLPTAIPQVTQVTLRPQAAGDRRVRAFSTAVDGDAALQAYALGGESRRGGWIDYVQGVTWLWPSLVPGATLPGLDLRIDSTVPVGSGLSSSAALLVALFRALRTLCAVPLSDIDIARACQRVENDFVGAPVGILDPMACGLCRLGTALFLDTRDLTCAELSLPSSVELIVIHSGITHAHGGPVDGHAPVEDYRVRRAECEQAAAALHLHSLRELSEEELGGAAVAALPAKLGRRVRHVLTENGRVLAAVRILKQATVTEGDLQTLGALFAASHASQRDDYAVSLPDIDVLVRCAAEDPAVIGHGARLTGGGFGGSIVALARRGQAAGAARRIALRYAAQTGRRPTVLVPAIAASQQGGGDG